MCRAPLHFFSVNVACSGHRIFTFEHRIFIFLAWNLHFLSVEFLSFCQVYLFLYEADHLYKVWPDDSRLFAVCLVIPAISMQCFSGFTGYLIFTTIKNEQVCYL